MSSSNTSKKVAGPRLGGKIIDDTSSSSDSDTGRIPGQGGALLNQSPYRPPQAREEPKDTKGKVPAVATPESTDSMVVVPTAQLGNFHFQLGSPAGDELFAGDTSSSAAGTEDNGSISTGSIDDGLITTGFSMVVKETADITPATGSNVELAPASHLLATDRHLVGNIDAQKVYSHTACLFIANLPQGKSDEALEAEVTRHFSGYGTVFVKIKRDENDMPFGFLQYMTDEAANAALNLGQGARIFERGCRLEMAKGTRTFVVFRRDRGYITIQEATTIVAPHGAVSAIEPLRADFAEILRLPYAIHVEFASFDCERDIVNRYRTDRNYRVMAFDVTKIFRDPPRRNPDEVYLEQYRCDRQSIFVGGLPQSITKDELLNLFGVSGDVESVQIVVRRSQFKTFAFIEFAHPEAVDHAIKLWHGKYSWNNQLVVQKKISRTTGAPRRVNSSVVRDFVQTPARQGGNPGLTPGSRRVVTEFTNMVNRVTGQALPNLSAQAQDTPRIAVTSAAAADGSITQQTAVTPAATVTHRSQLNALAPPFGPSGFFFPSPTPVQGFQGFQQGFFGGQTHYYQDPASGLWYPAPLVQAPMMVNQPIIANRAVSAMAYIPGTPTGQQQAGNPPEGSRRSVRFADTVENAKTGVLYNAGDPGAAPGYGDEEPAAN